MTIVYLGVAWLLGIWIASIIHIQPWIWFVSGIVSVISGLILRKRRNPALLLGIIGFICLGAGRGESDIVKIGPEHIAYYNGAQDALITGQVVNEPQIHDRVIIFTLAAENITQDAAEPIPIEGRIQVMIPRYPGMEYGTRLEVKGDLSIPDEDLDFDYRAYLARRDIFSQMSFPDMQVVEERAGSPIYHAIYDLKAYAQTTINQILPDPQAALLSGILLGNEDQIPAELDEQFRISGLSHIIAISGFNIAILAVILLRGSQPIVGRRYAAWVALGGVAIYTVLVGAEASVVRAAIMASIFIFATRFMGRPTFAAAGLFTAAVLMTLANPKILWDVGFQLSFAATLGLMIYVEPWKARVESGAQQIVSPAIAKRAVRFFGDIFIATLAAMLLTMPLVIYHFQQISVVSPLANFFVLPAQPGVMSWGIIATFIGMVSPALGKIAAWTVWPFLTYTISRAQFFASVQAASIPAALSTSGLIAIYLLIFGLTWLGWKGKDGREEVMGRVGGRTLRRIALTLSAIAAVIAVTWAGSQPDGKLHISFLDVGQGDATLIQTPSGRNVLIDGGAYPSLLGDEIGGKVPFWDRDIDLIIATHADEDHVAGLPPILERFDVNLLVTNGQSSEAGSYQALMNASAEKAVPVHAAQGGEVIDIGDGARLEILSPSVQLSQDPTSFADNDLSIVLRLVYGDFSMLLTGDAGTDVESKMIDSGKTLSSVVFHAGHHGAKSSNSPPFLREVNPEIVVISVGEDNRYGHPHAEVLERISEIGSPVLRTDQLGAIELITNGAAIWLKTTS